MAYTFNGSNQYIREAAAAVTAYSLTIAGWMRKNNTNTSGSVYSIMNGAGDNDWFRLLANDGAKVMLDQNSNSGNSYVSAQSAGSYTASTWLHACAVFTSSASRTSYRDGGNATTTTTTANNPQPASLSRTTIGVLDRVSITNYFGGDLAECAIWNVALTAAEIASLAKGFSPLRVRPQSLVRCIPLVRDLQEIRTGATLANTNSATAGASHPRTYR
jgi:hypothetical protein